MASSKSSIKTFLQKPSTATNLKAKLGAGSYAAVFDSDAFVPDTVVKRFSRATSKTYKHYEAEGNFVDAWLLWAVYCMGQKHRSFMPRIYALHIDWNRGTYHAIMEKLHHRENDVWFGKKEVPYLCEDSWMLAENMDLLKRDAGGFGINLGNFQKCLKDLEELVPQTLYIDGHSDNWMLRKGKGTKKTVVATDPLHISNSKKSSVELMQRFNKVIFELASKLKNVVQVGEPVADGFAKKKAKKQAEAAKEWNKLVKEVA